MGIFLCSKQILLTAVKTVDNKAQDINSNPNSFPGIGRIKLTNEICAGNPYSCANVSVGSW